MRDSTALPFLLTRSYSVFAVRRLRGAAGRDDDARVAAFVRDVRGSLYSTIKDELKLSLQHHAQPVSVRAAPVAVGPPSDISSAARTLQPRVPGLLPHVPSLQPLCTSCCCPPPTTTTTPLALQLVVPDLPSLTCPSHISLDLLTAGGRLPARSPALSCNLLLPELLPHARLPCSVTPRQISPRSPPTPVCVQAATLCLPQARDLFPGEEQDAPPGGGDEGGALTGKAAESHFCSKAMFLLARVLSM